MERFFNTAGPNQPEDSYTIDPLKRFDLDDILTLIRQKRYFVLHAPRQTGKTSCLLALRDYLNAKDDYIVVFANVEAGQAARNNVLSALRTVCGTIIEELCLVVNELKPRDLRDEIKDYDANEMLAALLRNLSVILPKPLVLFIDEIDALVGDSHRHPHRQVA